MNRSSPFLARKVPPTLSSTTKQKCDNVPRESTDHEIGWHLVENYGTLVLGILAPVSIGKFVDLGAVRSVDAKAQPRDLHLLLKLLLIGLVHVLFLGNFGGPGQEGEEHVRIDVQIEEGRDRIKCFHNVHHRWIIDQQATVYIRVAGRANIELLARTGIADRYRQGIVLHGPALRGLPFSFVIVLEIILDDVEIGQISGAKNDRGNVLNLDGLLLVILAPALALFTPVNG